MSELKLSLVTGHPNEKWALQQQRRLLEHYDLTRWQFTDRVQFQNLVISHSHPVLTLSPSYLSDDDAALSVYLHEQLHWFSLQHDSDCRDAGRELRIKYPTVPDFASGSARDEFSTYLHLLVCPLEYQSLIELIGFDEATKTLLRVPNYRWIYDQILADWRYFQELLKRHNLAVP